MGSKFRVYAKVVARQVLPPIVFSLLRPSGQLPKPFSLFHGKDQIDKKMLKYIDYDDGYFIEIGAGDGVYLSNTYYYEKYRHWSGVLIDPILHHHLSCLQHRPNSKSFLCAASSFENTNDTISMLYAGYFTIGTNSNSDIASPVLHVQDAANYYPTETVGVEFVSRVRTLQDILLEAEAPKEIDFLSLDVEGSELEVLLGLDFNVFKIKWILVESRSFETISDFLATKSYTFVDKLAACDYLFKLDTA